LSKRPLFVEDPPLLREEIHSGLIIPLTVGGRILGTFNVNTRRVAPFSRRDIEFLTQVANLIGAAVASAQAHHELGVLKDELQRDRAYWKGEMQDTCGAHEIVARLPSFTGLMHQVRTLSKTSCNVLVTGETGTGKEIIARFIHEQSPRRSKPFVKVDCASLPVGLIESEIFGHEKGAFTDARNRKLGRFELAEGGTIFLDEIGELPIETQGKLLRFLEEKEFERVGGVRTVKVDARLIAATNRDLREAIAAGRFREDLFYRLNVFEVHLKPLRERPEDIAPLIEYFLRRHNQRYRKEVGPVDSKTVGRLCRYRWPGNVRELEHAVERALLLSTGGRLEFDVPPEGGGEQVAGAGAAHKTLAEVQREHIRAVLSFTGGVIDGEKGAAKILGLHPNTLRSKMQRLGLLRTGRECARAKVVTI
jgi:formate hydrogenlyase transcriptional activator